MSGYCEFCGYGNMCLVTEGVCNLCFRDRMLLASAASSRGWTVEAGVAFMPCVRCDGTGKVSTAGKGRDSLKCQGYDGCNGSGKVPAKA